MKRLSVSILCLILAFLSCGCSLWYSYVNNAIGPFDIGYAENVRKAFFARYTWDGSEAGMNIVLPESYEGVKVTGLGGYTGRGVPSPFVIEFSDELKEKYRSDAKMWARANCTVSISAEQSTVRYLDFNLHISKNIEVLEYLLAGGIIVAKYEVDGEIMYDIYVITCYVTCDENNRTFYAKDGKLYYRSGDKLVEDIVYRDFDLEEHNKQYTDNDSKVWFSVF